jgi:hypothetical protein
VSPIAPEADAAPYERLVALAELEAGLVASGAWEDLPALAREREASVAVLPAAPPPAALPLLERLAGLQALITAALDSARTDAGRELGALSGGNLAVRGYAAGVARPSGSSGRLDSTA